MQKSFVTPSSIAIGDFYWVRSVSFSYATILVSSKSFFLLLFYFNLLIIGRNLEAKMFSIWCHWSCILSTLNCRYYKWLISSQLWVYVLFIVAMKILRKHTRSFIELTLKNWLECLCQLLFHFGVYDHVIFHSNSSDFTCHIFPAKRLFSNHL